jgi:hypothetical protein
MIISRKQRKFVSAQNLKLNQKYFNKTTIFSLTELHIFSVINHEDQKVLRNLRRRRNPRNEELLGESGSKHLNNTIKYPLLAK